MPECHRPVVGEQCADAGRFGVCCASRPVWMAFLMAWPCSLSVMDEEGRMYLIIQLHVSELNPAFAPHKFGHEPVQQGGQNKHEQCYARKIERAL